MKTVTLIVIALLIGGCTSSDEANRALSGAGYKNITVTGYRVFGCSEDDSFHTGFEATGPTGTKVTGVVCSAFMKGATIRTD